MIYNLFSINLILWNTYLFKINCTFQTNSEYEVIEKFDLLACEGVGRPLDPGAQELSKNFIDKECYSSICNTFPYTLRMNMHKRFILLKYILHKILFFMFISLNKSYVLC